MGALKTPSKEELTELKRLKGNPTLTRYFQSALDHAKDSLVATSDTDQLRVLQGQAQTLAHLLKFISL